MELLNKAIYLTDFWYKTDFSNFKNQYDGINDAICNAVVCITTDRDRTIEIIKQDIEEIDDPDFTQQANTIIDMLTA